MRHWFKMEKKADREAEVTIYDFIGKDWMGEGVDAASFYDQLRALGEVETITLRVNSPGGVVTDGVAMYNLLDQHPARIVAVIDGIAASAASLIVMAADEIVIPENAFMLIHEPRGLAWGTASDARAMAEDLDRMTEVFALTYAKRTGGKMDVETVKALMAEDRLMTGAEAVERGLADRMAETVRMAASFDPARLPVALREKLAPVFSAAPEAANGASAAVAGGLGAPGGAEGKGPATCEAADRASALEIVELCTLAGFPQMAAGFLREGQGADAVRAALMTARAAEDAKTAIHTARPPRQAASPAASWDRHIDRINSRVAGR